MSRRVRVHATSSMLKLPRFNLLALRCSSSNRAVLGGSLLGSLIASKAVLAPPPLPLLRLSSLLRRILVIYVSYTCAAVVLQTILHPTIQVLLHPRMRGFAVLAPPTALPLPLALALLPSATPIKSCNAPFVSGPQPVSPAPYTPRI